MQFSLKDHPHRRYNPLTREWILVSPHRTKRPWQGQVERPAPEWRSSYDPTCYLCPGNERAGGLVNPHYAGTFCFDNDFAALLPDVPAGACDTGGLLRAESGALVWGVRDWNVGVAAGLTGLEAARPNTFAWANFARARLG